MEKQRYLSAIYLFLVQIKLSILIAIMLLPILEPKLIFINKQQEIEFSVIVASNKPTHLI